MAVYGYARISTKQQSIERQIRNIKSEHPDAVIVEEVFSGTSQNRAKWNALYKNLKSGDTVVFDSVSRMSRNAEEGFSDYLSLMDRGIELIFLKEPHINTSVYKKTLDNSVSLTGSNVDIILKGVNQYLLILAEEQIRLAFQQSEKEVLDLRKRTSEGVLTARLNGKQIGLAKGTKLTTRKSVNAKKIIKMYSRDFDGFLKDEEVLKLCGISKNSYYKYKKELKERVMNVDVGKET